MQLTIGADELLQLVVEEIWNHGDLELADALFTDDYLNHGGLIPDLIRGPEAIKRSVALYRSAFPAFQISVDVLTSDHETVEFRWVAHDQPPLMNGLADTRNGMRGITRCRFRGGQIAESWTVWDSRVALALLTPSARRTTAACNDTYDD